MRWFVHVQRRDNGSTGQGMLKRYGCQARGKEEDHRQAERRGRLSESS